eukprot:s133_g11.t1
MLLKCRCRFAWHLRRSFSAMWRDEALSPTAVFPLPAPHPGCFSGGGPGLRRGDLVKLAQKRLLHINVFCLNILYLGRFPSMFELGRQPNKKQVEIFQRLRLLLTACGTDGESYPTIPGRSGSELGAAIFQLEKFLEESNELGQSYVQMKRKTFQVDKGLLPVSEFPQLEPDKNLDVEKLRIVGEGLRLP